MANLLVTLHSYNVYLIWATSGIATFWGFFLYFTKRSAQKPWLIVLAVAAGFALLQALLGVSMAALGLKPGTGTGDYFMHYVYGALVALGVPLAWIGFTTNGKNPRRDLLVYSLAALVIFAIGFRAWMTGFVR